MQLFRAARQGARNGSVHRSLWHGMVRGGSGNGETTESHPPINVKPERPRSQPQVPNLHALFIRKCGPKFSVLDRSSTSIGKAGLAQILVQQDCFGNLAHRFAALAALALHGAVGPLFVERKIALQHSFGAFDKFS